MDMNNKSIDNFKTELEKNRYQLNKTYDLLEQDVYTKEIFLERSNYLKQQIADIKEHIRKIENENECIIERKNNKEILIPKIEKVIDTYYETENTELKNKLLKSILEKVEYLKINPKNKDDFKLKLYPKIY